MISNPAIVVILLAAFFLLLPCRFDPAIRLKEWQIRKQKQREEENK